MNDELIKAVNIIKDYCTNNKGCFDCILCKPFRCTVYKMFAPCVWDIPTAEPEPAKIISDSSAERIAELHREVDIRDRYIEELKQEVSIKDEIIRKQGVLISKLKENQ